MTPYPLKIPGRLPHVKLTRTPPEHWQNLPRRKCDFCGKSYKPSQPFKKNQKFGFCTRDHKVRFHEAGGAYVKLKDQVPKEINRQLRLHTRCPTCKRKRRTNTCPTCHGTGEVFTSLGEHLKEFMETVMRGKLIPSAWQQIEE